MKATRLIAAIALAAQNLFAHDGTEWIGDVGWNYTVENGEATISNAVRPNPDLIPGIGIYYGPAGGDLVVPATVGNGIPVTTVMGAGGNELMTGLTIPAGVRTIGPWAFRWNYALAYVTIPDTVTNIDEYAFQECTNLTQITLPPRLAKIGEGAFARCYKLNRVVIPSTLKSISIDAFRECDALKEVLIPNGVEEIGESAFSLCRSLTDVTIPASVKSCGPHAFSNCSGLKRATLNAVGPSDYMFLNCTSLTDVTIPEGATGVGIGSFWGCSSLRSIVLPRSLRFVDSKAFKDCASLQSITMPRACYKTYTDAYAGCPGTLQFVFWEDGGGSGGGSGGGTVEPTPTDAPTLFGPVMAELPFAGDATYNGWVRNADGTLAGLLTVKAGKAAKPEKGGQSKLTVTYTPFGGRKQTIKLPNDAMPVAGEVATVALPGVGTVKLTGDALVGVDVDVQAGKDTLKSKDKAEKAAATAFAAGKAGVWTFALGTDVGYAAFTVTVDKKGKGKLAGTLPDGTKVSVSAQGILGDGALAIPFAYAKKGTLGLVFWVKGDGTATVSDLTGVGTASLVAPNAVHRLSDGEHTFTAGGVSQGFTVAGKKWNAPKQNKKADPDPNPTGLKLSFTEKTGAVKGSYTVVDGKAKTKYTVVGVVVGGRFYGSAYARNAGSASATAE